MQSLLIELDNLYGGVEKEDFLFSDGKFDVEEKNNIWGFYDGQSRNDVFVHVNFPHFFTDKTQEPDEIISLSFSNVQDVVLQLIKRLARNRDAYGESALSYLFAGDDDELKFPIQVRTRIQSLKGGEPTVSTPVMYHLKMNLEGKDHWIKYTDKRKYFVTESAAKTWYHVIDLLYLQSQFVEQQNVNPTNFLIAREFYTDEALKKPVSTNYRPPKNGARVDGAVFAEYLRRAFDFMLFYLVYPLAKEFLARHGDEFRYASTDKLSDVEKDLRQKLVPYRNDVIFRRTHSKDEEKNNKAMEKTWQRVISKFNTIALKQGAFEDVDLNKDVFFQWAAPRFERVLAPSYDARTRRLLREYGEKAQLDGEIKREERMPVATRGAVRSLLALLDDDHGASSNAVVEQAIETGCPSGASFVHADACNVYGGGKNNNTWGTLRPWFAGLTKNEYGGEVPFFLTICGLQPFIKFFIERARKEKYDKGDALTLKKMKTEEKTANVTVDIYYLNNTTNQTYFDSSFPITMKLKFYNDQLIYKTVQEGHKGNGSPGGISDKTVPYVASATFPKKLFRKAKSIDSWWAGSAAVDVFERIILNLVYPLVYVEFARKEAGTPFLQNIDNFLKDKVKREAWMSYVWSTQITTHNLANQRRNWHPSTNGNDQYQAAPARQKKYDVAPPKSSEYGYISVLGGLSSRVASSNEYESLVLKKPSGEEFSTTVMRDASETATSSVVDSIYAVMPELATTRGRSGSSAYTAPEPGYGQLPGQKTTPQNK